MNETENKQRGEKKLTKPKAFLYSDKALFRLAEIR